VSLHNPEFVPTAAQQYGVYCAVMIFCGVYCAYFTKVFAKLGTELVQPPKVNPAVLSSPLLAMGRPTMVMIAMIKFKHTLAVPSFAKTLVKYAQ
jgi:hypothetical protein